MERKLINGHYKIIFSDEDIQQIISLSKSRMIDKEIANRFGVSKGTICNLLHKYGFVGRKRIISQEEKDNVCELYDNCRNQTEVHRITGINMKKIHSILVESGRTIADNSEHRKYCVNSHYFDEILNQNQAYILGFLYADGCMIDQNNNYSIQLFLQECDKEIIEKISNELDSTYPIRFRDYQNAKIKSKNQYGIKIEDKIMYNSLMKFGLTPRKSLTLEYPTTLGKNLEKHFIRGYFDGDGGFGVYEKGSTCCIMSTFMFCEKVKEIVEREVGVHCSIYHYKNGKTTSTLQISGRRQIKKFLDWLYDGAEMFLKRKHDKYIHTFYSDIDKSDVA